MAVMMIKWGVVLVPMMAIMAIVMSAAMVVVVCARWDHRSRWGQGKTYARRWWSESCAVVMRPGIIVPPASASVQLVVIRKCDGVTVYRDRRR